MNARHVSLALAAFAVAVVFPERSARSNLPASAISELTVRVYGMYTTADPLCHTDLVATVPLSATPKELNLAGSPSLGTGPIPADGIQCVVLVFEPRMVFTWAPGTYTTTSQFGTSTFNDSNCNAGGTLEIKGSMGCQPGKRETTIDWPSAIKADLATGGITAADACDAPVAPTALPLFLSTASACVGEVKADEAIGGDCTWTTHTDITPEGYRANTPFQAPRNQSDSAHGIKINPLPAGATKYKLLVDPTPAVGGSGGSDCGGLGPPRFAFEVTP
jgi:hypothetical protein